MSHHGLSIFEPGRLVAGRFRLDKPLGKGGMGEVWLAHHVTLDIPCAVKFIRGEDIPDGKKVRFEREAQSAAKLRSPNVVQILDYGVWEDTPYIAMELLEGETLGARLQRCGRLSAGETLAVVQDVARALSRAGDLSIVHRDLKPDNIFIVKDGSRELVKVLDFGVAKMPVAATAEQQTATGTLIGTPYFMSPEQAHGEKSIDGRSDLWSLAVIAFRCLTGELPFKRSGLGALLQAIMLLPIPVPSHRDPTLPRAFDRWWEKAASRNVDERFQTPEEFVTALEVSLRSNRERAAAQTRVHGTGIAEPQVQPDAQSTSLTGTIVSAETSAVGEANLAEPVPGPSAAPSPLPAPASSPVQQTLLVGDNTTHAPLSQARPSSPAQTEPTPSRVATMLLPGALAFSVLGGLLALSGVFDGPPPDVGAAADHPTAPVPPSGASAPASAAPPGEATHPESLPPAGGPSTTTTAMPKVASAQPSASTLDAPSVAPQTPQPQTAPVRPPKPAVSPVPDDWDPGY